MKCYYFAIKDMAVNKEGAKCEAYAKLRIGNMKKVLDKETQIDACALFFRISRDRVRIITKQEYHEHFKED